MSMARFGMATPIVCLSGPTHNEWEHTGTIEDLAEVVKAADRLGFDHVQCSEHVVMTQEQEARRGGRYFDPLATFGYLSAITTKVRFVTAVLVLAYHHPLEIAKRYGTLDLISGGRLVLGVGVGTLKPEFDVLGLGGAEFEERGARADDALKALKASLGRRMPEYHGRYYDFQNLIVDPCALQQDLPLWIGGRTMRSLRRAVELADGWLPFWLKAEEMGEFMKRARDLPAWAERKKPLELVLNPDTLLDPVGDPRGAVEAVRRVFAVGATMSELAFVSRSRAHHIEQMEAMAGLAGEVFA